MGRLLLISRLAACDVRRRPAQAALLLVVIAAAMAALTLGLVLHGVTADVMAEGREQAPAVVDQPKVLQGTWVHSGGRGRRAGFR